MSLFGNTSDRSVMPNSDSERRKFLSMIDTFSCRPPFIYFIRPFKEDSLSLELLARTGMRRNVGINVAHNEYFFA